MNGEQLTAALAAHAAEMRAKMLKLGWPASDARNTWRAWILSRVAQADRESWAGDHDDWGRGW